MKLSHVCLGLSLLGMLTMGAQIQACEDGGTVPPRQQPELSSEDSESDSDQN